jgi:hypothetical protein
MSILSRLFFAWACFFRVLIDADFASRALRVRDAMPALLPAEPAATLSPEANAGIRPIAPEKTALPPPEPSTSALLLLALLQREGRLIDFLQEDLTAAADADIGIAARVVHEGCRRALRNHIDVCPIRNEPEDSKVELLPGFDAASIKLTGHVTGAGPYRGVLRHGGWRAENLRLPEILPGYDARILAQAEVEL